jgi:hypothetical protein
MREKTTASCGALTARRVCVSVFRTSETETHLQRSSLASQGHLIDHTPSTQADWAEHAKAARSLYRTMRVLRGTDEDD